MGEACLLLGRGPCLSRVGEATPEEAGRAWAAGSGERPAALGQARLWLCDLEQVTRLSSPLFKSAAWDETVVGSVVSGRSEVASALPQNGVYSC